MRIILIGKDGQLGRTIKKQSLYTKHILSTKNLEQLPKVFSEINKHIDTKRVITIQKLIDEFPINEIDSFKDLVIINCIAQSNTRVCEEFYQESYDVNVAYPILLTQLCKKISCHLVHISTGCIFDGNKEPHYEYDKPTPLISYSRQKYAAESILKMYDKISLLRPRMIFSDEILPSNLLYKITTFGSFLEKKNSMTYAPDLVKVIDYCINDKVYGPLHTCNKELISPAEIASIMYKTLDVSIPMFFISKKELHKKVGLKLTDTWIETDKLPLNFMPDVRNRIEQAINNNKKWLLDNINANNKKQ